MDKYAIFGDPVDHSVSPFIHQAFAQQTQQSILFEKYCVTRSDLPQALQTFQAEGGKGCNITLPLKEAAYALADDSSHAAQVACAASGLLLRDDGEIYAENYDGIGLVQDLLHNHHFAIQQKNILIIGAGGAVRGILGPLIDKAPAHITIANRTLAKAQSLIKLFHLNSAILTACDLSALSDYEAFDLVIHATSLGHQGKVPLLPDCIVSKETWCYDLTYGKSALPFLTWAKQQGVAVALDGLGMVVEHNAALFYLWRGIYPDSQPVIKALAEQESY